MIPVLGSQPAGDVTHQPGGRLPLLSAFQGVNSLPKTVTRQRRGCDLNPGPSAPESSTLTTRLPSHQREEYNKFDGVRLSLRPFVSLSISPPPDLRPLYFCIRINQSISLFASRPKCTYMNIISVSGRSPAKHKRLYAPRRSSSSSWGLTF